MKMEKNHLIDYQQIERTVRRAGAVMKEAHLSADAVRRKEGAANFVTKYDVEIQNDGDAASPQRARYHSGLMDMHMLRPGQDFSELPESHVIFITEDDVLGHGLPIYHAGRKVYELDKDLGDGEQIIYVNAGVQDDTELGRLMHDLHCKNADEMYSTVLVFGSVSNTCCLMRQNMSRE